MSSGAAPQPTILVVDDDASLRELLCQSLHRHGFKTIEAVDGQSAFEIFSDKSIPLAGIVTDFLMPRMDGAALIRKIKEANSLFPVVLVTGEAPDAVILELAHHQRLVSLTKPFRPLALRQALDNVLGIDKAGRGRPIRASLRVESSISCLCVLDVQGKVEGIVKNLSFGGSFVEFLIDPKASTISWKPGDKMLFVFQGLEQYQLEAQVVWKNAVGVGLSFTTRNEETELFFKKFVLHKLKQKGVGVMGASSLIRRS